MNKTYVLIWRAANGEIHFMKMNSDTIEDALREAAPTVNPAKAQFPDLPLEILGVVDADLLPPVINIIDARKTLGLS